jgi:uncharacterized protein
MELVEKIKEIAQSNIKIDSDIHGIDHWDAVHENAIFLSMQEGVDELVVRLFAYLHDSKRYDDNEDYFHGERAAQFVDELCEENGALSTLSFTQRTMLRTACYYHNKGVVSEDITIGACYDADRLELVREGVNILPDPKLMSTPMGKKIAKSMQEAHYNMQHLFM